MEKRSCICTDGCWRNRKQYFETQATRVNHDIFNASEKYFFIPTKVENQLYKVTIFILEVFNRDRAKPFRVSFYPVSSILENCDQD